MTHCPHLVLTSRIGTTVFLVLLHVRIYMAISHVTISFLAVAQLELDFLLRMAKNSLIRASFRLFFFVTGPHQYLTSIPYRCLMPLEKCLFVYIRYLIPYNHDGRRSTSLYNGFVSTGVQNSHHTVMKFPTSTNQSSFIESSAEQRQGLLKLLAHQDLAIRRRLIVKLHLENSCTKH